MKKVQNFTTLNLLFSLVILIIGVILITNTSFIINILSWIIGGIFGIIGIIKIISYFRHKSLTVDTGTLMLGIFSIIFGINLFL